MKTHVVDLEQPRELLQLVAPGAAADQDDPQVLEIAQKRRRADQRVEILRVPDVPGVHDDELVVEPVLARPRVVARARLELRRVDPVRDHDDPIAGGALVASRSRIVLADRDDAVGTLQVEARREAKRLDQRGVVESLERDGHLGEDVLADDDERRVEAPGEHERDVGDDRADRSCRARRPAVDLQRLENDRPRYVR